MQRSEEEQSKRMQSILRSDAVAGMQGRLRLGDACPVCHKQIRKNDGSGVYRKKDE